MIIFAKLLVIFINVISNIINFFKRNNKSLFKSFIYDNLRQTYYEINVNDQKISFFCPSQISVARINDFFEIKKNGFLSTVSNHLQMHLNASERIPTGPNGI